MFEDGTVFDTNNKKVKKKLPAPLKVKVWSLTVAPSDVGTNVMLFRLGQGK